MILKNVTFQFLIVNIDHVCKIWGKWEPVDHYPPGHDIFSTTLNEYFYKILPIKSWFPTKMCNFYRISRKSLMYFFVLFIMHFQTTINLLSYTDFILIILLCLFICPLFLNHLKIGSMYAYFNVHWDLGRAIIKLFVKIKSLFLFYFNNKYYTI